MENSKTISLCLEGISVIKITGDVNAKIFSVEYDSRKVKNGSAFFALSGIHTDGKNFIPSAIQNGAKAIFYEDVKNTYDDFKTDVCYIQVENIKTVMSKVSSVFYDNPSTKLGVIGVTGTEGKSSTVSFIFQLLNLCGKKTGFFSTVEYSIDGTVIPNLEHQTTPESNVVQERLAQMYNAGCEYAVVESSSHGLSFKTARLADVLFDVGVFMNVTQEHLEFHGTLEQYRYDKANLFRSLDASHSQKQIAELPIFGVVNYEDKFANYFINATQKPVYAFSTDANDIQDIQAMGGLVATDIMENSNGINFKLLACKKEEVEASIKLAGIFNVKNVLASILVVNKLANIPLADIIPQLIKLRPIKGRMMKIDEGQDFEVIIDYAHTPSSFMTIFPTIKQRVKQNNGRVICVFGSGGERDLQKRPEQGRIASEYTDIIILADEDPRGEKPEELLEMIAAGVKNKVRGKDLFIIPDRPTAIKKAFSLARKNDVVLLLGKGHENSIIYKDYVMPYDEEITARYILRKR